MTRPFLMLQGADKIILGLSYEADPDDGPILPKAPQEPGITLVRFDGEFSREGRRDSEVAQLVGDDIVWTETASLEQLREEKASEIGGACREHIERGFECLALGSAHLYPANAQDQANLVASVTDSLLAGDDPDWRTPFWCVDAVNLQWKFRQHTAAQIRQVGREGKASILAAMQKNEALRRQIAVATADELKTITW